MATLLYRIGRFSYRRARLVVVGWLLLLAAVLGGGVALQGQMQDSFSIPGTESQQALDQLSALFPQVAGASAQAVVVAPAGALVTEPAVAEQIERLAAELREVDGVEGVLGPFDEFAEGQLSDDGSLAIVQVQFDGPSTGVSDASIEAMLATAEVIELRVEFGGQLLQETTPSLSIIEAFGVLIAAVVLVVTFGSLRAAWMPIATALAGVGIVMGGVLGLAAATPVSAAAPLLALMIGLAVGIDYALFIVSRHRTQLARGMEPEESAAVAVATAGSAVLFAGVTVIIALLGLLVVNIPFLSIMGATAALAVAIAVLAAITMLPALLGIAGARLVPRPGSRAARRADPSPGDRPTMGRRWVRGVMRRPVAVGVGVVALLGVLSAPVLSLDLNLPGGGMEPAGSTQREAYELIAEGFGPGKSGPLLVTVDITQTVDILDDLEAIGGELAALEGVQSVGSGIPDPGLVTAIIQVVPDSSPTSVETKALVEEIRALAPDIAERYGTPIAVTGTTAIGIDISNRLSAALLPFTLVVVGLSIVLLMAVFRSVLVPLKAALGFLLSAGTAIGVVVAVFQWGWGAELLHTESGPILSFLPIILMAVLFGLAMDYEVFLVSGMREEFVRTKDPRAAIENGFATGARVVTAAALIMFFIFAMFVPEGSGLIKPMALGLAVGIAVDAFLVRMTLGPALMTLFGKAGWWFPRLLDRALPELDIEGERLAHHREHRAWADAQESAVVVADRLGLQGSDARLSFVARAGDRVDLVGDAATRRLAGATLAGYLPPRSGRAVVADAVLPSEASRASRRVTLVDVGGERLAPTVTIGALVSERIALAAGYPRAPRRTSRWLARLASTVAALGLDPAGIAEPAHTVLGLDARRRAIVLAAVATIDATPVMVLDHRDDALEADDIDLLDALVQRLAPASLVRIWGREPGGPPGAGAVVAELERSPALVERSDA